MKETLLPVPPIALSGLGVRYDKRRVLDGVTLSVPAGSVYALLGRNGAGKSSAIRCLLGQQRPSTGAARLFGRDAWRHRAWAMGRIGVVPEEPDAPPAMTSRQLGAFCARLYDTWDPTAFVARLSRFGVPAQVPFGRLSKGQKAQVALALALGPSPELLVLDDPTLGLDVVARRDFFGELCSELADRRTTVLLTTHDLAGVEGIVDSVGMLKDGQLVLDDTAEAMKESFRRIRYRRSAGLPDDPSELGALDVVRRQVRAWEVETVVQSFDPGAFAHACRASGIADAEVLPMSLEEIFTALLSEDAEAGGQS